jgi:hypothetical protein
LRHPDEWDELFDYAVELEYILGQDWNRPKDCIDHEEAERRVRRGLIERREERAKDAAKTLLEQGFVIANKGGF